MESIGEFLKKFFGTNRKNLLENYPGLNEEILKRFFFDFAGSGYNSSKEFFSSPKWWADSHSYEGFFKKLQQGVPLQYILGIAYFYKYSFLISPGVFIPRPETEMLVEMALIEIEKVTKDQGIIPKVLDLGTGSGAIIISLGEIPIEAVAYDLNPKAIATAKENFFKLGFMFSPLNKIRFVNMDFFEADSEQFNIVVTNPPYIKQKFDFETVHPQVVLHEPNLALFIDDRNYDEWFDKFFNIIYLKLAPGGILLMEGHENHLKKIQDQAKKVGFLDIMIVKDLNGKDRFLRARKNG